MSGSGRRALASAGSRMGPVPVGCLGLCSQVNREMCGWRVMSSDPARTPDGAVGSERTFTGKTESLTDHISHLHCQKYANNHVPTPTS